MKGASFKDVVIRGKELSGALITALINVYIKDNAPVDAISNHLRDICPLLYSSDDSVCSKVTNKTFSAYSGEIILKPWVVLDEVNMSLLVFVVIMFGALGVLLIHFLLS